MTRKALPLLLIFVLILAAAATGIFSHGGGPNFEAVTVRGQHAVFQGSGLYRDNPASFAREGVVWDVVNLFLALPLFAVGSILALRGSSPGRLLLGGLLAYFWYVYLSCAMMYAFNNFFLVYVAILALTSIAFVQNFSAIDIDKLPELFGDRFPRRLFIGYSAAVGAFLIILWLARILQIMRTGRFPQELAGLQTLGSQALDLGLLAPLAFATTTFLHRRSPWGHYLASLMITFGMMMFVAIPAWITVPLIQDGKANLFEAIPFFLLSVAGIALALTFYTRIQSKRA